MINIIGAGLFGAVARDLLRSHGIECRTFDDGRPLAGSWPAGCLTKPSWLSHVRRSGEGLAVLHRLYPVVDFDLKVLWGHTQITHVPPASILRPADIVGKVVHVQPETGEVELEDGSLYAGRTLVAAGVWSKELLPEHFRDVPLVGLQGSSQRYRATLPEARLHVWAPYKQSVAFNIEPGVAWFGDGTAIKPENFAQVHIDRALKHAEEVGLYPSGLIESRVGIRPYVKGHAGWFRQAGARCWVSTGGAKNGVVLAAVQALQFLEALQGEGL